MPKEDEIDEDRVDEMEMRARRGVTARGGGLFLT